MLEAVPLPVRRLSARSTSPSGSAWDRLPEDDLENGKDARIPGMAAGRGSGRCASPRGIEVCRGHCTGSLTSSGGRTFWNFASSSRS